MRFVANFPRQKFYVGDLVYWNKMGISGIVTAFYLEDGETTTKYALLVFAPGLYDNVPLEKYDYTEEDKDGLLADSYGMDYCCAHFGEMRLIESASRIKTLKEILIDL